MPEKPSSVTTQDSPGEIMKDAFRVEHEYDLPDGTHCKMRRLTMTEFLAAAPKIAGGFTAVDWAALPEEGVSDTARGYAFMIMLMSASWATMAELLELLTGRSIVDDFEIGLVHLDAFLKVHTRLLPTFFSIVATFGTSISKGQMASISGRP